MFHYDTFLQNATNIITKCDSCFVTKCDISLLQNVSRFSSQNAAILLQSAKVITNSDDFIKKCNSYYKMRPLLQIARVHSVVHFFQLLYFELKVLPFRKVTF